MRLINRAHTIRYLLKTSRRGHVGPHAPSRSCTARNPGSAPRPSAIQVAQAAVEQALLALRSALSSSPDFISGLYGCAAVPFGGTAVQPQAINRVGHNMSTNIKPAGLWEFEGSLVRCGWLVLSLLQDVDVPLPQYGRKMLELLV